MKTGFQTHKDQLTKPGSKLTKFQTHKVIYLFLFFQESCSSPTDKRDIQSPILIKFSIINLLKHQASSKV